MSSRSWTDHILPFSFFQPFFLATVSVRVIIGVMEHHGQKHLGEGRVYLAYVS